MPFRPGHTRVDPKPSTWALSRLHLAFALMTNEMKEEIVEEEDSRRLIPEGLDPMSLLSESPLGKAFSFLGK